MKEIKKGDIYIAEFDIGVGSEQNGERPVIVLQNDKGNLNSSTTIVAAITSKDKKDWLPTHIKLPDNCGLALPSTAILEQIRTIDRVRLVAFVGTIKRQDMKEIDRALAISLAIPTRYRHSMLLTLCPTCRRNFEETPNKVVIKADYEQKYKDTCCFCNTRNGYDYVVMNAGGAKNE